MFAKFAAVAAAITLGAAPAFAGFQTGRLAGYDAAAMDAGRVDTIQIYGPRGVISIGVSCSSRDYSWVGNAGDGYIADRAVAQWCGW